MLKKYIDVPWPLRLLAVAMLVASYVFVYRPIQDERDSLALAIQSTKERSALAQRVLQNTQQFSASAQAIRKELGSVRTDMNENQGLAFLLVDLDRAAHGRNVQLVGVDPQRSQANANGLELLIHARGHYGDLIHYLGDIVMTRILLRVSTIDLQRDMETAAAGQTPLLDATIRVVLVKFHPIP